MRKTDKQRKSSRDTSRCSNTPVSETKMAGPYGVLDGEDLQKTQDGKVQNGGRGGIRTLGGR